MTAQQHRYLAPGWFTTHIFNGAVQNLTKIGISVAGSRVLRVRGRSSGEWRSTPINLLTFDGERYLIAPRGTTQWVRNLRVAGAGELRVGRRTETFTATELAEDATLPILREYLRKWGWEVGQFFEGIDKSSTDEQLNAVAAGFPVFRVNRVRPAVAVVQRGELADRDRRRGGLDRVQTVIHVGPSPVLFGAPLSARICGCPCS